MRIYKVKESACVDSVREIEVVSMRVQCVCIVREKRDRVGDRFGDNNYDDRL